MHLLIYALLPTLLRVLINVSILSQLDARKMCGMGVLDYNVTKSHNYVFCIKRLNMLLTQFDEHTWVIQGGANIGVITYEDRCLIIDSGMDKDAGREILVVTL